MPVKKAGRPAMEIMPILKSVEQMSVVSGIGINRLRELMDRGELEYVQNGNRRLIADQAIWDWYQRNRVVPQTPKHGGALECL